MSLAPPLSQIDSLISPECQQAIRGEIETMKGAEIFFVGRLDSDLVIEEVESYAFGNRRTVPALLQYARPGDVILHNHPSGNLEPSSADIDISSTAGERGIGSYIINNDCTDVRIVVKAVRHQGTVSVDVEALAAMLSPGGRIAERLEGYEFRPVQLDMLRAVTAAFNENGIAAIEADTGTGKSMAYLLPAIAWSLKNQEKVVVATNTINLQEQIIEKDLPLLRQTLGLEFDAVLLKGRNNYLCKRKTDYLRHHPEFLEDKEKEEQLEGIFEWVKTTRDGSLSDLAFTPDTTIWEKVMSESDNCLRTQCPFYQSCFFYNARRRAARANVLVVNHHLLMADLAVRAETENYTQAAVLPPFHRIILDEAHHLEEVATSYFGSRFSRGGLFFLLRRLASPRTGEGLLRYLSTKIHEGVYALPQEAAHDWMMRLGQEFIESQREVIDALEEATDRTAIALDEMEGSSLDRQVEIRKRITEEMTLSPMWEKEVRPPLLALIQAARPHVERLRELASALQGSVEKETPEIMSPLLELKATIGKIERQIAQAVRFLEDSEGQCRWIEYRRRGGGRRPLIAFCVAPLDVADSLRDRVLRRYKTVIMTSATLTVEKKFDYFLGRIGADAPERLGLIGSDAMANAPAGRGPRDRLLTTLRLNSPFDYDDQVYTGVPSDLPSPKDAEFPEALSDFLLPSLRASRGRAFVLFTSYSLLNQIYDRLSPTLEAEGYPCLKQGSAGRSLLTEMFRRDLGSVLFATASFWEGVDIPGEALSCVVLTRLPFTVPGEPIIEARVEAMRAKGIDPFLNLIVPQAVIRFRQGFGRLIRRREDRGAVLICDNRVLRARFGQMFLKSLPTSNIQPAPAEDVIRKLKEFYRES